MMTCSKIKDLFREQFGADVATMPLMEPLNVNEANIGILGHNFKTKKDELTRVNFIVKKEKTKKLLLKTALTENEVGEAHLFYTGTEFLEANKFKTGDMLFTKNGLEPITDISELPEDFIYDMETDLHNFYSNGVLSHNSIMSHAIATCVTLDTIVDVIE